MTVRKVVDKNRLQFDIYFIVALNPTRNKEMLRNKLLGSYGEVNKEFECI